MRRPRFTVGRIMWAVVAVALLLAGCRAIRDYLPHFRECWRLASYEERKSRACLGAARRYRGCLRAVPCGPSEYCWNACLEHDSSIPAGRTSPGPSADRRRHAEEQHLAAARAFEEAGEAHAARARLYRRAAFRPGEPPPSWRINDDPAARVSDRYRCDTL